MNLESINTTTDLLSQNKQTHYDEVVEQVMTLNYSEGLRLTQGLVRVLHAMHLDTTKKLEKEGADNVASWAEDTCSLRICSKILETIEL